MGAAIEGQDVVTVMRSGTEKLMVILYLRKLCSKWEAAPLFTVTFVPNNKPEQIKDRDRPGFLAFKAEEKSCRLRRRLV